MNEPRYSSRERLVAGVMLGVVIFIGVILTDVLLDGAIAVKFGSSPAMEAERIAREAVND